MPYTDEEKAILSRLGQAIRKHRQAKGWSQEELAFQAELDRTYIGSVERGERNIAVLNLVKIAVALETDVHELVSEL